MTLPAFPEDNLRRVEVYRLEDDGYRTPQILGPEAELASPLLPGFNARIGDVLGS